MVVGFIIKEIINVVFIILKEIIVVIDIKFINK